MRDATTPRGRGGRVPAGAVAAAVTAAAVAVAAVGWVTSGGALPTLPDAAQKRAADLGVPVASAPVDADAVDAGEPATPLVEPSDAAVFTPNRADIAAAGEMIALDDHGRLHGAARWEQPIVRVEVGGDAASPAAVADVDRILRWLTEVAGREFTRVDGGGDLQVRLVRGAAPRALVDKDLDRGRIVSAVAQWDPTHPHASRWAWEEMLHAVGPSGDWAHRPDSVLNAHDQTQHAASAFDTWVIARFYAADELPTRTADLADTLGPAGEPYPLPEGR